MCPRKDILKLPEEGRELSFDGERELCTDLHHLVRFSFVENDLSEIIGGVNFQPLDIIAGI